MTRAATGYQRDLALPRRVFAQDHVLRVIDAQQVGMGGLEPWSSSVTNSSTPLMSFFIGSVWMAIAFSCVE